jgi:hypothetical protein
MSSAKPIDTSLPWSIIQTIASTSDEPDRGVSIVSADGETVIAQRVMSQHAEMIVLAVNAMFTH